MRNANKKSEDKIFTTNLYSEIYKLVKFKAAKAILINICLGR